MKARHLDSTLFPLALKLMELTPAGYLNNKWAVVKALREAFGCSQTQAVQVTAQVARRLRNMQVAAATGPYVANLNVRLTTAQADRLALRIANGEADDASALVRQLIMGEVT